MAVEPVLASTLWAAHNLTQADDSDPPSKRRKLSIDCQTIDKALHGGLEYGKLYCVSAEVDCGAKEVSYAFLKSHLLDEEQASATIIDITNSFDVRKLHFVLMASLRNTRTAGDPQAEALKTLNRVRITKAFDFVGLTESVAELREDLEGIRSQPREHLAGSQDAAKKPRDTIGDSEVTGGCDAQIHKDAATKTISIQEESNSSTTVLPLCIFDAGFSLTPPSPFPTASSQPHTPPT